MDQENEADRTRRPYDHGIGPGRTWADVTFLLMGIAAAFGTVILMVWLLGETDIPMPCDEEEVYVWVEGEFPFEAECVSATDHGAHNAG